MNTLPGRIVADGGRLAVAVGDGQSIIIRHGNFGGLAAGRAGPCSASGPRISCPRATAPLPSDVHRFSAPVTLTESLGNETLLFAQLAGIEITARMQRPRVVADGEVINFLLDRQRLHLFDADTGRSLRN